MVTMDVNEGASVPDFDECLFSFQADILSVWLKYTNKKHSIARD